ncbi:hypothetical protein [Sphingomonas faeni]|uniref:hypothetical protein n=1 Tax=Sphingomonas faeni TaxID=185950 RepID=UPI00277E6F6A|nr:hypothetical protein [Sphingomonas faeni]MDQ0836619.1 hypothetical protein [Sphingomonas faeni]
MTDWVADALRTRSAVRAFFIGNPEQERIMAPESDPRTAPAPEDIEDATNQGVSAHDPAEGSDDTPGRDPGSAEG